MPQLQDEDIRIIQLPEAQSLVAGMKVAVDSETDGTKQLDLKEAIDANGLPPCTAQDAGKVLTVNNTGFPEWGGVVVVRGLVYKGSRDQVGWDSIILDKTYAEIDEAYKARKKIEIHFYIVDGTPTETEDIDTAFNTNDYTPFVATMDQVASGTGPDMQRHNDYLFTFRSPMPYQMTQYGSHHNLVPFGASAFVLSRSNSTITIHLYSYRFEANCVANATYGNILGTGTDGDSGEYALSFNWDDFYELLYFYIETRGSLDYKLDTRALHLSEYQPDTGYGVEPYFKFTSINSSVSYSYVIVKPKLIDGVNKAYVIYEIVNNS